MFVLDYLDYIGLIRNFIHLCMMLEEQVHTRCNIGVMNTTVSLITTMCQTGVLI